LQSRNLKLEGWQIPPCDSDPWEGDHHYPQFEARKLEARVFADEMRKARVSIFEADPKAALASAQSAVARPTRGRATDRAAW
jgi:hypothetical protein